MAQAKQRKKPTAKRSAATGKAAPAGEKAAPARDAPAQESPAQGVPAQAVPPGLARRPVPGNPPGLVSRPGTSFPAGLIGPTGPAGTPPTGTAGQTAATGKRSPRQATVTAVTATAVTATAVTAKAVAQDRAAGPATDKAADTDEAADEDVPAWAAKLLEQLLHVTCWLDPGESGGEPYTATVRFTGQRTDVTGKPTAGDTFTQDETYAGIVPGSGPVAVTAQVRGVNRGSWSVTARPLPRGAGTALAAAGRVPPPRRITVPAGPTIPARTTTMLRSKVPGIIRYAYTPLVVLGVLIGLVIEALLLATAHYPVLRPIGFSVAAVAAGVIGGKAWYGAVHRWRKWDGWCIQGFVAGAAVVVAAVAVAGPGLPAGAFLAAATPALLIGMGVGRHACFWAGCCTGRPTASRFGIWSSDRRLGCRRMPVQLYEAWTALVIGGAALAMVAVLGLARTGPVAVIGLGAYTLIRQGILGLRDEPRAWRYGRPVTAVLSFLAVVAGAALLAVG